MKNTDEDVSITRAAMVTSERLTAVLEIDSGPLRGLDQDDLLAFLGIPYAAPPLGALRWMPPQPPKPWQAILSATKYSDFAPQNAELGVFSKAGGDEDCLYLNVFVSKNAKQSNKKLAVFVWIHGGSLLVGTGNDYNARKLALDGDAVVVTFNYRLGILGFLAHPELDKEGHACANYGFMDQTFALDWVQRNIAAFGGDPANVTIAGESSGGNSVFFQMASPWGAGKFQHAISMSGAALILRAPVFGAPRAMEAAQEIGIAFAKAVGCENKDMESLRKVPVGKILATQGPYVSINGIIDGDFLPMHPGDAFRSGNFNRATLINGSMLDEGAWTAGFMENESGVPMTAAMYADMLKLYLGDVAAAVLEEYPVENYQSPSEAFSAVVASFLFACPAQAINRWVADKIPTYAYQFADRTAPSYLEPTTFVIGAGHTFELSYIFPGYRGGAGRKVELNDLQAKLSDRMVHYWTTAAQAGKREEEWPRYRSEQDNFLRLVLPAPAMATKVIRKDHNSDFWDKLAIY